METMRRGLHAAAYLAVLLLAACGSAPNTAPVPLRCPQPRFTGSAPAAMLALQNPLDAGAGAIAAGRATYAGRAGQAGCVPCHGERGDGHGPLAEQFTPPPRNFACASTIQGIPDGQLFWIIRNGSPGTAMPAHPDLTDTQVWQLVSYLRELAR